jgi:hypothetical protein
VPLGPRIRTEREPRTFTPRPTPGKSSRIGTDRDEVKPDEEILRKLLSGQNDIRINLVSINDRLDSLERMDDEVGQLRASVTELKANRQHDLKRIGDTIASDVRQQINDEYNIEAVRKKIDMLEDRANEEFYFGLSQQVMVANKQIVVFGKLTSTPDEIKSLIIAAVEGNASKTLVEGASMKRVGRAKEHVIVLNSLKDRQLILNAINNSLLPADLRLERDVPLPFRGKHKIFKARCSMIRIVTDRPAYIQFRGYNMVIVTHLGEGASRKETVVFTYCPLPTARSILRDRGTRLEVSGSPEDLAQDRLLGFDSATNSKMDEFVFWRPSDYNILTERAQNVLENVLPPNLIGQIGALDKLKGLIVIQTSGFKAAEEIYFSLRGLTHEGASFNMLYWRNL